MRVIIFILSMFMLSAVGLAQKVQYFNMDDRVINSKDRAFYYQKKIPPKKKKSKEAVITVKEYYVFNDQLKREAYYLYIDPTLLSGEYTEYYITGQLKAQGSYNKGDRMEGFTTYHYNGQLASKINKNEEGSMVITEWDHFGEIMDERLFIDHQIYSDVEEWPYFLGGKQEFNKFLGLNMKYPFRAASSKVEGKVYVQFIVNHDGSISEIEVIRGIGSGCDEEAVRVISLTDKMWKPGKKSEMIVKTRMVVPISFKLTE